MAVPPFFHLISYPIPHVLSMPIEFLPTFTFAILFSDKKQACGPEVLPKAGLPGRAMPEIQSISRLLGEK